jgi:hypothetical protein
MNHFIYLKKQRQNLSGSFKNLSIHRDSQREVTSFYTMLLAKVFVYYIMRVILINLLLESFYPLKKPNQNLLGSFKDLSIHRDRQRGATLLYTML